MKPQRFLLLSSIFLAILFFFNTSPVTSCSQGGKQINPHPTVKLPMLPCANFSTTSVPLEDEREFSYVRGSKRGPEHWGELKNSWSACGTGKLQSPIDLSDERVRVLPQLGELRSSYHPANAVMKNRGHDIEVSNNQSRDFGNETSWLKLDTTYNGAILD